MEMHSHGHYQMLETGSSRIISMPSSLKHNLIQSLGSNGQVMTGKSSEESTMFKVGSFSFPSFAVRHSSNSKHKLLVQHLELLLTKLHTF